MKTFLQCLLMAAVSLGVFAGYDQYRGRPAAYVPPLGKAAKNYEGTLGFTFQEASRRVTSGELATKKSVVDYLASHAKPLADALDAAFAGAISADGTITNRPAAAETLEAAATALGK